MPKYLLQWKDPDFCDAKTGEHPYDVLPEDEVNKLRELGAREYIVIEFDTDAGIAKAVPRK